jgi:hypothetical protein
MAAISLVSLISCGNNVQLAPSNLVSATALSNHYVEVVSYEIPKGLFRGALWPQKDRKFFVIWNIDDGRETFFELKPPPEFVNYEKEVTADWEFKIIEKSRSSLKYSLRKKDGSKQLHLLLPIKKRDYSFYALDNSSGDEILIFMDISEKIIDSGLFGYVTITNKT